MDRPRPAGELVALTGLSAPTVSEHLKVLRKTGLLVLESRGRFRYYQAEPMLVQQVADRLVDAVQRSAAGHAIR